MMGKKKVMRIFRKVCTFILCIVMFVTLAVGVVAATMNSVLSDSSALVIGIIDSKYNGFICDAVYAELDRKMALVVIETDDISDIITEDVIIESIPEATGSLMNRLLGGNAEVWRYENKELRTRISELLTAYAAENSIEYEEGSADQVYDLICDTVSAEMNVIPQSYISKVSPLLVKLGKICSFWYIPILVYVLCTAAVICIGRRHIKNAVYNAILPSYFASFVICTVTAIMYSKDYFAKTIIKNETFQHIIKQVYNSVLLNIRNTATVLSAMFIIMALVVILSMSIRRHRRTESGGKTRHSST